MDGHEASSTVVLPLVNTQSLGHLLSQLCQPVLYLYSVCVCVCVVCVCVRACVCVVCVCVCGGGLSIEDYQKMFNWKLDKSH